MKLAQFKKDTAAGQRLGVVAGEQLIDLAALAAAARASGELVADWLIELSDTRAVIGRGAEGLAAIRELLDRAAQSAGRLEECAVPLDAARFLPPVWAGKILAIGRNYYDHALEGGVEPPPDPLIFNKLPNALNAHNAPIVLPAISSQVDYEAELAVVIGRRASCVAEDEALDYVFGYAPFNDVSARDLQFGDGQWVRGKGLDGFAPLGPAITTRDEIRDVHALRIEGRLNGRVMQSSNTGKMIFKVPYLIAYISQAITLEPGDVIATGTPEGVGYFRKPPVLLQAGDVFEVEIEQLGTLKNPVGKSGEWGVKE